MGSSTENCFSWHYINQLLFSIHSVIAQLLFTVYIQIFIFNLTVGVRNPSTITMYFPWSIKPCWAFSYYVQLSQLEVTTFVQAICIPGSVLNQTVRLDIHFNTNDLPLHKESSLNQKALHFASTFHSEGMRRKEIGINLQ